MKQKPQITYDDKVIFEKQYRRFCAEFGLEPSFNMTLVFLDRQRLLKVKKLKSLLRKNN